MCKIITERKIKIIASIMVSFFTFGVYFLHTANGTDFTPTTDSYHATPTELTHNQSDYQKTAFTSDNYQSVAQNDDDYVTTTAQTSKTYVEDVFSAYTYTGNGSTQTINNGIDLAGKGGLVWTKLRDNTYGHSLVDSARGITLTHDTSSTAQHDSLGMYQSFNSNGYTAGPYAWTTLNGGKFVSWTFRKAPKFFDVVTFTSTGSANQRITHGLGQVPGMIVVKRTDATGLWYVYHNTTGRGKFLQLNTTETALTSANFWGTSDPTDADFGVGAFGPGQSYVAYIFAHDTSEDGLIQCGDFTTDSLGKATVDLGWEPQFIIQKSSTFTEDWFIRDVQRGWVSDVGNNANVVLRPNLSSAESGQSSMAVTNIGFKAGSLPIGQNYVYCAIRKGPMKMPTNGNDVYNAITRTGAGNNLATVTSFFSPDSIFHRSRSASSYGYVVADRLRGSANLSPTLTESEFGAYNSNHPITGWDLQNGVRVGNINNYWDQSGDSIIEHLFRRAPGFFDVVTYTGDGLDNRVVQHNLGTTPELIIQKRRNIAGEWRVFNPSFGAYAYNASKNLNLHTNAALSDSGTIKTDSLTATQFLISAAPEVNASGDTFVTYLYATLPGISKVGSYTGNGTNQTIDAGFTGGARYIMIKRTDSTGDWLVWDTVRGITTDNDPHISLNTTTAEVTSDDSIDPDNAGFIVNQNAATNINVNGANYIYYAVSGDTIGEPQVSGAAAYASQLYTFDPVNFTNYAKLDISLIAQGTAQQNGITTKIYNNTTDQWDTLTNLTNTEEVMPSTISTQSITANPNDYFDENNKVKILVHTTHPSSDTQTANLNTDLIKISAIGAPDITTNAVTDIAPTTAIGNATVTNTNGEDVQRQIEWGTQTQTYTSSCTAGIGTVGAYACQMTNLTPNTTYYVRAKAINSASTSYGQEVSFTTQAIIDEIVIQDPDGAKIENAITNAYFTIQQGTQTNTQEVKTNTTVKLTTTNTEVTLPPNTNITENNNNSFDFTQFHTINTTQTVKTHVKESLAAVKIGVPNTQMHFSNLITLTLFVGDAYNTKEMQVLYQEDGETTWNPFTTCIIANGQCTFQTDHATTYTVNGDGTISGAGQNDITTDVQDVLSLDCDHTGNTNDNIVEFGNLTPGTPVTASTTCTVTTNSDAGYTLAVKRNDTTSTMDKDGDEITDITDKNSWNNLLPNATAWSFNETDLAFTVYDSTATKNTSWWGTGTTVTDANNLYAGFPTSYTDIMQHTSYNETATTTQIGYKLDVSTTQKSGIYSGDITYQVVTAP